QAPAFSAGRVGAPLSVRTVAGVVGAVGAIDLLSAMTPPLAERLARLEPFLPLALQQGARLTSAVSGFALMVLAASLWRRKRVARWITLAVLLASSAAHLVKGLDYEEAALGLIVALWLWSLRDDFVARSDGASVQRALRLTAAAAGFTLVYGSLGFYLLDRHYQVRFDLRAAVVQTLNMFARYQNPGLVPLTGFGRYFAGSIYLVGAATLLFGLLLVLRPVIAREPSSRPDRQRARAIVEAYGRGPQAALALLPDKRYHFSEGGSVVAYVVRGPVALALGDPIGPGWDAEEAIEAFGRHAAAHGWMPAWYETGPEQLERYRALGYQLVCLGHEAIVDLRDFSLEGGDRKDLRTKVRRVARDGYQAQIVEAPHSEALLAELREVSQAWLDRATGREKAFSLGWFDEDYLNQGALMLVHDADGRVMAFANLVPEFQLNELTIDLMRHRDDIVPNTMLFLFTELMLWAAQQGYDSFNLGMAPLYGVGDAAWDPALDRALKLVFERGGALYSFKGLASFKSRFHPGWTPRYLAYPGPASLPAVAVALVRAISGDDFAREMMREAIPLDRLSRLFGDRAPSGDGVSSTGPGSGESAA
ncbi:MAG: bifunctional lysylphosphatidylglycerol flippase/synthetase MprF, partial [Chloroflexi bacterium]|nr:bifunctional lysylphosphatidylglycerol flippase/synthetase MprF [Chloroflexota bacterium]